MKPQRMLAMFVLSIVTVATVGVFGARLLRRPTVEHWPGRFAVIGLESRNSRQPVGFVGVADPSTQIVVEVPVNAVVEIPGTGFLRIFHAYRLGGQPLMRSTLARLFAVDVPFSAVGTGGQLSDVVGSARQLSVPVSDEAQMKSALAESKSWERRTLAGELKTCENGNECFILDPASVTETARLIGGLGTKVFVDPTNDRSLLLMSPQPTTPQATAAPVAPAVISVEVLNGGKVELAATKTANALKSRGYNVVRIADRKPQTLARSVVYFKADSQAKAEQVAAIFGYVVEALPANVSSDASVVVVLGNDAKV